MPTSEDVQGPKRAARAERDLISTFETRRLDWSIQKREASVATLLDEVRSRAQDNIDWYMRNKRPNERRAQFIRMTAIVLGSIGGILPMLTAIRSWPFSWRLELEAIWSSVLLAVAASLVLLDRFFGYSSGWVRFVSTGLHLRQLLQEFEIDVELERSAWSGTAPSDEQLTTILTRTRGFVSKVNEVVREETSLWIAEFQDALKQVDEWIKAKSTAVETGSVAIVVTNGDQYLDGWSLTVGPNPPRVVHGKTAVVERLDSGPHRVLVEGAKGGVKGRAETIAVVRSSGVVNVEVTLA